MNACRATRNLSIKYAKRMREKLAARTAQIIATRGKKACFRRAALKRVIPGLRPRLTKTSLRASHRPRVLLKDNQRRARVNL